MKRLKCVTAYDGTDFSGYQVQPNQVTIQGEIEAAIKRITGESIQIIGSGRTDSGVHACGQVFHFDTKSTIPVDKWSFVLNNQLSDAIVIRSIEEVDASFHARFDVKIKEYRYCIDNGVVANLFRHRYSDHIRFPLDLTSMRKGAAYLVGENDFTSFCSAKTVVEDKVRTVYDLRVERAGNEVWVICRGNGFLYNMVRIIVGTLVEVGQGKRHPDEIREILLACDRERAGKTAPAKGLTMWEVCY